MKVSKLLGIISIVLFLCGILSFLLPIASAIPYAGHGVSITTGNPSISGNSTTVELMLSNHGFLPVNGILLNFTTLDSRGNTVYSEIVGPLDLAAGSTATRSFSFGSGPVNSTQSAVSEKVTAKFNLAGIVPISLSLTANLSQGNSTSTIIP
jgi:hypothetical protein